MKKRRISTITIIAVLIIIIILVIIFIPKTNKISSNKKKNEISSPKDFKNVEQAIKYTGSKFISESSNSIYLSFKYPLYSGEISNQKYYLQLMNYVANVKEYKDFYLIDEEKDINIEVTCDKSKEIIENYRINTISNYFGRNDSKIAIKNYIKTNNISLNIQSSVIKEIINKKWEFKSSSLGSLDSTMDDYKIYFDEGYNVRVIENDFIPPKIFNIVFTQKYKGNVVNNISTSNTFEEIENILGTPTFNRKDAGVIGYKSDKIYVFFVKQQEGINISVYNVENYDTSKFAEIITNFNNNKSYNILVDELFKLWSDPDIYTTDNDYVLLQYSNRGVKIEFNTNNPSGITIYKNFSGNITKNLTFKDLISDSKKLPINVYFKNEDLVFQSEMNRVTRYTIDDNVNLGNELFFVMPEISKNGARLLNFFSTDGNNPNFQIYDNVYNQIWADKTHFIYSVTNKGIYIVDVITRKQTTLISGKSLYRIKNIKDKVLYYDDTSININF